MLERHLWRDFAGVTSSVAVLGLGVGSTLPLTALALTARGQGPEVVGWMTAAIAAGGVLGVIAVPAATLRFGRRSVMLCGVALAAAAVIALQFVHALYLWGALRVLFGAAMAPLFVVGEAWINSLAGDAVRGRVVAIYTTSFTLCQVIGPLLTDVLVQVPDRAFAIGGAVFLFGLPGIALARDETDAPAHSPKDGAASWWAIVRTAPAIIAGAALFAAFDNVMLSFLPLFALDRGFTQTRALTAVTIVFLGDATLQFAVGSLADRFGRARVHGLAGIAACLLLPLLPWMIAVPVLWECYLFVLGGIAGSIYTLALVSSGERFRGPALLRASGLIALTWNIASTVGSAATGVLMQHLGSSTMTIALTAMAIAFLIANRWERRAATAERPPSGA